LPLFQKTVFKIKPVFSVFAFYAAAFGGRSAFICLQAVFLLDTVTVFFVTAF
jgi:hypothetical protein